MYQTIENNQTFEVTEKKSKFIANLFYINSKEEAEKKVKELKKHFFDARHNCFAYRVLEKDAIYEKSSDDGEPSGTAGAPMLNILQKNNLCNVLVIVTRYFGGILLGTGGLVRCYSSATIGAVENASKKFIELGKEFEIKIDYSNFQSFQYYCQKNGIKISENKYEEDIVCKVEMTLELQEKFYISLKNKELAVKDIKELGDKYVMI